MAERVPLLPPPGLNSDATKFQAPGVWSDGSNVRFYHGQPQCIGGEKSLQSGALEVYAKIRKIFAYKVGSTVYVALASDDISANAALKIANSTTWARTNIGPAAGITAFTNASFAMFGDVLLWSPTNQTLYESVSGATAAAIAAAPDNITAMLVTPSRQVMALGCNEEVSATFNGRCIRWSDIGVRTTWTTLSSNNAGEYILPGQDNIIGGGVLGDYVVIWTQGALWLGQYIGQPGQTFVFTRIDSTGLIAQDCWATLRGAVYWVSPEGKFYGYRVGGVPFEIPCPVGLEAYTASLGPNSTYNAVAVRRFGEVWFSFGTTTSSTAYCYCVDESASAQRPVWFKAKGFAAAVDSPILANALNMEDSTSIKIHSSAASSFALKSFDLQGGLGDIAAWEITSSYFYLDEGMRRVQVQKMANDEKGDYGTYSVQVSARDYPDSGSFSGQGSYTITNDNVTAKTDMRTSGRVVQVKFHDDNGLTSATAVWRLGKPVFDVAVLGNR